MGHAQLSVRGVAGVRAGLLRLLLAAGLLALGAGAASAEVATVRLARQFGISYMPLALMQELGLLEIRGREQGLELKTEWLRFTGGSGMNEALLSGNLDFASGGVGPFLTIWGRTLGNIRVRGVATLNAMPLWLVTVNPAVRSVRDLGPADRIAMPTAKTSIQALTLQMEAARLYGEAEQARFDPLMVSMGHPDAQVALLGGRSEITAHFGSAPFQDIEMRDPRARKILDSYAVLGGPHTFNLVWASTRFVSANPRVTAAFLAALEDALRLIRDEPARAVEVWIKAEAVKMDPAEALAILRAPENEWTTAPKRVLPYLEHMNRAGLVAARAASEAELFFPSPAVTGGSAPTR